MRLSVQFKQDKSICIYENNDIMVSDAFFTFPNGTKDAVIYITLLKNGKISWVETSSTPLT